jgi:mannosyltransferase
MSPVPRALIALTALAAALRLPTLGSQSLWLDETLTGGLARGSLGDLFHTVAGQEANPPLFYLLEWAWTRVAGTSEVALRLPSALFGIALVPVAFAIGRRLGGQRAAVALGALVAVNPLLVYYSQEARGYAAVALACAIGFLFLLDALEGKPRAAAWWALASAVALGCHYFAIFPVAIEAAILLARRGRSVLPALGGLTVAGAALLPLISEQIGGGHSENVTGGVGLAARVKAAATSWLVGERGAAIANLEWLVGALLLAAVVLVVVRRSRAAVLPAAVGGGAAALMVLAAAGGEDYLNNRNTLPALAIALAVPALGFAIGRTGAVLGAAAALAMAVATIGALTDPAHAREDWRATVRDLGPIPGGRAVVVAPAYAAVPLRWYRPALAPSPPAGVRAIELDVVLSDTDRNPLPPRALDPAPVPGFIEVATRRHDRMLIVRYRAGEPIGVEPEAVNVWARNRLDAGRGKGGATLLR